MNADQARQLLLVRAVETTDAAPIGSEPGPAWSAADKAWADAEALRSVGEQASVEQWLLRRAELAGGRLAERDPRWAALQRPTAAGLGWLGVALLGLALLTGLASDVVGPAQRINLLAPPLLAVMAWNLLVYAALLWRAMRSAFVARESADGIEPTPGPLARIGLAVQRRLAPRLDPNARSGALQRFATDWTRVSQPLQMARLATVMHFAALAVAAGALAAMYLRGLVFEFNAGWDSTFLGAEAVHRWLATLLAPALALSGQALPDPAQLELLRFARSGGENAARWIHLYAITTALLMLPRLLLAALAMWRSRRLQRHFALPLDDRYFKRLQQWLAHSRDHHLQLALVLPYSYSAAPALQPAINAAVDEQLGPGLQVRTLPNLPLGAEDSLDSDWLRLPEGDASLQWLLPLFALSATPERETHGAFLRKLVARAATIDGTPSWRVMIDESGFRQRLAGVDLAPRLDQRRTAWRKLVDECGGGPAWFVDLAPDSHVPVSSDD